MNTYAYVSGNPSNQVDPKGLRGSVALYAPTITVPAPTGFAPTSPTYPTVAPTFYPNESAEPSFAFETPVAQHSKPFYDPLTLPDNTYVTKDGRVRRRGGKGGEVLACSINNRDKCQKLLDIMQKVIYQKRSKPGHDTLGIAHRYYTQMQDPGNFYTENPQAWDTHNQAIIEQQNQLRDLVDEARKNGCDIPPEVETWLNVKPPSAPHWKRPPWYKAKSVLSGKIK